MGSSSSTPLDYMLYVMNDPSADVARRDRMAIAAAPFVHARADEAPLGKKAKAQAAAEAAGLGNHWGDDLRWSGGPVDHLRHTTGFRRAIFGTKKSTLARNTCSSKWLTIGISPHAVSATMKWRSSRRKADESAIGYGTRYDRSG